LQRSIDHVVPTIVVLEVFKRVLQQRNEHAALETVALLHQGRLVDLTAAIAIAAANVSQSEKLPMTDSIIIATARAENAVVWTQDSDFEGRPGIKFRAKK
jgi:toxin FitB